MSANLPLAPPPSPADVGIVAALEMEIGPLLDALEHVRRFSTERHHVVEGRLAGKVVAAIVSGPGRKAARRGTQLLLAGHRPSWVLSAGYGGALDPALKRNDVVFPGEVIDPEGTRLAIDLRWPDGEPSGRFSAGRLLTVDRIARTAAEKADLRRDYGADVVDMETSAVAVTCAERGARLVALRIISDEAGTDLPPEILTLMGPTGGYRIGAALAAIWHRPSSLKDMLRLREQGLEASERLAAVVAEVVARLP